MGEYLCAPVRLQHATSVTSLLPLVYHSFQPRLMALCFCSFVVASAKSPADFEKWDGMGTGPEEEAVVERMEVLMIESAAGAEE